MSEYKLAGMLRSCNQSLGVTWEIDSAAPREEAADLDG